MDFSRRLFLYTCMLLLLICVIFETTVASKTMCIDIIPSTVVSQEMFTISVFDPSITNGTPYLTDVEIIFDNKTYEISSENDTVEITIQAPTVLTNTTYTLTAKKDEYTPTNITLIVIVAEPSYELFITPETDTIQANHPFEVIITDAYDTPIEGSRVFIQGSSNEESISDKNGHTMLTALNSEEITIIAQKQGYVQAEITLFVLIQPGVIETLTHNPNFSIAIAALILITVIIYVARKNRLHPQEKSLFPVKDVKTHILSTQNTQDIPIYDESYEPKEAVISQTMKRKDPKIEEIHISSDYKTKDIVTLQIPIKKSIPSETDPYRWFDESTDINRKIDTLPTATSQSSSEKWFVGTSEIEKKIDETIKEKDKKTLNKQQIKFRV